MGRKFRKGKMKGGLPRGPAPVKGPGDDHGDTIPSSAEVQEPEYLSGEEDYIDSDSEGRDGYRRGGYHPVNIGDAFKSDRYVVLLKLGWGHFSTVWLVHDRETDGLGALKIQKSATHYTEAAQDEIKLLTQIRDGDAGDDRCCCRLLDTFDHNGPHGRHVCMLFEVLGDNLLALIKRYKYRGIPLPVVRNISRQVLVGLDYMHRELEIIHTDLKPENVMLGRPLASREWRLSASQAAVKELMAAAMAAAKAENRTVTKNQKKKLKKKIKKQLTAAASTAATSGSAVPMVSSMSVNSADLDGSTANSDLAACQELAKKGLPPGTTELLPMPPGSDVADAAAAAAAAAAAISATPSPDPIQRMTSCPEDAEAPPSLPPPPEIALKAGMGCSTDAGLTEADGRALLTGMAGTSGAGSSVTEGSGAPGTIGDRFFRTEGLNDEELELVTCKIVDFGNACWRKRHFTDDIQTRQYRSPEVIVGQGYDTSTDLWSFACMIFELVTGDLLFDPREARDRSYSRDEDHLALMMELLGPMPVSMTVRGRHTPRFFEREGRYLKRIKQLNYWPLNHVLVEKYDMDPQEAQGLAEFLLRMLKFHPESRSTAQDLLDDPWLKGDLPEAPPELHDIVSRKRHRSGVGTSSSVPPDGASASGSGAARSCELSPVKTAGALEAEGADLMAAPATVAVARSGNVAAPAAPYPPRDAEAVADVAALAPGGVVGDEQGLPEDALEAVLRRSFSCPARLAGGDDAARFGAANGYNAKFCTDLQRYAVTLSDLAALERRDFEVDSQASGGYPFPCYELVPGGSGGAGAGEGPPAISDQAALIQDIYHLAADPAEAEALRSFNYNTAVDYAELLKERNAQCGDGLGISPALLQGPQAPTPAMSLATPPSRPGGIGEALSTGASKQSSIGGGDGQLVAMSRNGAVQSKANAAVQSATSSSGTACMFSRKADTASAALQELLAPRSSASAMAQITCQPADGPAFQGGAVSDSDEADSDVDRGTICQVESMDELANAGARTIYRPVLSQPVEGAVRGGAAADVSLAGAGDGVDHEGSNEQISQAQSAAAADAAAAAVLVGDMSEIAESKSMSSTGVAENTASAANVGTDAEKEGSRELEARSVCGSGSTAHRRNSFVRESAGSKGKKQDGSVGVRGVGRTQASDTRLSTDNMLVC